MGGALEKLSKITDLIIGSSHHTTYFPIFEHIYLKLDEKFLQLSFEINLITVFISKRKYKNFLLLYSIEIQYVVKQKIQF